MIKNKIDILKRLENQPLTDSDLINSFQTDGTWEINPTLCREHINALLKGNYLCASGIYLSITDIGREAIYESDLMAMVEQRIADSYAKSEARADAADKRAESDSKWAKFNISCAFIFSLTSLVISILTLFFS